MTGQRKKHARPVGKVADKGGFSLAKLRGVFQGAVAGAL